MDERMIYTLIFVVAPFVIGIVSGSYIVPRLLLVSIKSDWARMPNEISRKSYTALKIAGISIFPVLLITLCGTLLLPMVFDEGGYAFAAYHMVPRVFLIITGFTILFIAGLKYDMHGSSSFIRFLAILLASCLFPASRLCITDLHGLFGIGAIPLWIGAPLTVLVSMYVIEMVKLLDGMDGLASGTSVIILGLCIPLFAFTQGIIPAVISSAALGVALPFFIMKKFSLKWQKAIMGNSGSYLLGYVMAYVLITSICRSGTVYAPGTYLIVMSVMMMPALDILRVVGSRAHDGRSLITQDRNQINYKILRTGIHRKLVFPVYMFFVALFFVVTYLLVSHSVSHSLVLAVGILLWVAIETILNYFIHVRNRNTQQYEWNMVYGKDAWDANISFESIVARQGAGRTDIVPAEALHREFEFVADNMSAFGRHTKRLADMIMSAVCLVLFSPLLAFCYILIKIEDGGPAIYSQERIGRFGQPFVMHKFRSMRIDAEKHGPQLSHANGRRDERLTKVGRFLRSHHLDELPQLWNVLRGDMAFVGYRPERQYYIEQIVARDPRYTCLYQIRPGVTSYATLYNGYTDTVDKMIARLDLDLYYLANRTWWFDCKVLFLTFASIVFGKKF